MGQPTSQAFTTAAPCQSRVAWSTWVVCWRSRTCELATFDVLRTWLVARELPEFYKTCPRSSLDGDNLGAPESIQELLDRPRSSWVKDPGAPGLEHMHVNLPNFYPKSYLSTTRILIFSTLATVDTSTKFSRHAY
eukprot:SAG11_NODE_6469_length_1307_cov_1.095199_1_plen_135_part_00